MLNGAAFSLGIVGVTGVIGSEHGAGAMAHPLEEAGQRGVE